jgi:hypothetical protein
MLFGAPNAIIVYNILFRQLRNVFSLRGFVVHKRCVGALYTLECTNTFRGELYLLGLIFSDPTLKSVLLFVGAP